MNHATTCKFCRKPLVLSIDDDYSELGDCFKLLKFAACNRCSDVREKRRRIEATIGHCCNTLNQGVKGNANDKLHEILSTVTRKYAEVIAQIYNSSTMIWNQAFADLLYDRPDRWGQILQHYCNDCADSFKRNAQEPVKQFAGAPD